MPVDYPVLPTLHSQLTGAELTGQKIGQGYLDARSTLADIGQTHSASALNLANARRADALSRLTGEQTKRAQAELTAYQKDQRIQDMVRDIKKFDLQIQQSPQYRALYKEDKMMSLRSQFSESSRVYTQSILDKLAPIRKMVDDGDLQGAATAGVNLEQTDPVIQQELQKPNSPLRYVWDLYNSGKPGAIAKANKLMDYFQDTLNIPAERAAAAAQAATDRETQSKIAVEEVKNKGKAAADAQQTIIKNQQINKQADEAAERIIQQTFPTLDPNDFPDTYSQMRQEAAILSKFLPDAEVTKQLRQKYKLEDSRVWGVDPDITLPNEKALIDKAAELFPNESRKSLIQKGKDSGRISEGYIE